MKDFDLKAYLEQLESSPDIEHCQKVPLPEIKDDQNYIFISYSHADYKEVYKILAHMYNEGVHFVYDLVLQPGDDWRIVAKNKIRHPNCSGAIFFLSKSLFKSEAVINTELPCILGIHEGSSENDEDDKLNYFSVNLSNKETYEIILNDLQGTKLSTDWIMRLCTAFGDSSITIKISEQNYINRIIDTISNHFNVIDLIEKDDEEPQYIGEYRHNKYHGKGKMIFPKNDPEHREYYEGDWVDGVKSGFGTMRWTYGKMYEGEWESDAGNGKAKITYLKDNNYLFYEGDCKNCVENGHGVMHYRNGDVYDGEWKDGTWHGSGTVKYPNGKVFKGIFINDRANGPGKHTFEKDDYREYQEGEWKNGNSEGPAIIKYKDGTQCECVYSNGQIIQATNFITKSGNVYNGEWKDGNFNGHGVMKYTNGDVYDGEWKDGNFNGHGVMKYTNGDVYDGEWKDGYTAGTGIKRYKDGRVYEGEWNSFGWHGSGTVKYPNGKVFKGIYINDRANGPGKYTFEKDDYRESLEGEWKNGKSEGPAIIKYKDGTQCECVYSNGQIIQATNFITTSGNVYNGEWKDGNFNGRGVMKYTDGDVYDGEWKDGTRHGYGVMRFRKGGGYIGQWKNGYKHGRGFCRCNNGKHTCVGEWDRGAQTGEHYGVEIINGILNTTWKYVGEIKNHERNGVGKLYRKGLFSNDFKLKQVAIWKDNDIDLDATALAKSNDGFKGPFPFDDHNLFKLNVDDSDLFKLDFDALDPKSE